MTPPAFSELDWVASLQHLKKHGLAEAIHLDAPRGAHGKARRARWRSAGSFKWTEIAGAHAYPCGFETLRTSV